MSRILLSGASGFIGKALADHLVSQGDEVVKLSLRSKISQELNNFDAVIHLAGEPLVPGRWTASKRSKILQSRAEGTHQLAVSLSKISTPPKVFICASAIGYYGDRGDELLMERSSPGQNFLSKVCVEWEQASSPLQNLGIRVVHTRFGMVLGAGGGALQKMLLPFQLGLGAILGSGKQWVSWVELYDLISAIEFILKTDTLEGPINIVAPEAIRQEVFAKTLGEILHRNVFLRMPVWLVKLLFGQMGEEMLLVSERVVPEKLVASGFKFTYSNLRDALKSQAM